MLERLRNEASGEEIDDSALAQARLLRMVEDEIDVAGPIRTASGRRRLVALVGPTGVGKTTTIAKLAANFRLRDKRGIVLGLKQGLLLRNDGDQHVMVIGSPGQGKSRGFVIPTMMSFEGSAHSPSAGISELLHVRQCVHALVDAYRPLVFACAVVTGEE